MTDPKAKFDAIPLTPPPLPRPDPVLFGSVPEKPIAKKPPDTVPTTTAPTPPPTVPSATAGIPDWLKAVFVPTRTHGVLAVAASSLLGGWYGVKTLFPPSLNRESTSLAKADATPDAKPEEPKTLFSFTKPPEPTTPIVVPELPTVSAFGTTPSTSTTIPSVPPPTIEGTLIVPIPGSTGTLPEIKPVGFLDQPTSVPAPTIPSAVGVPTSPLAPIVTLPSPDTGAVELPITLPAATPGTVVPAGGSPPTPVIPQLPLGTENKPVPAPKIDLTIPSATAGAGVTLPSPTATTPAPAVTLPSAVTVPPATSTPVVVPSPAPSTAVPLTIAPDLTLRTTPPAVVAPPPPATPPSVLPTGFGSATTAPTPTMVTPTASTGQAPLTDFDVDLHYVKTGESFASIAKLHYGDERYGTALEQFNRRGNFDGRVVQVPPTHWIRKQTGQPVGRTAPAATAPEAWTGVSTANADRFVELAAPKTFRELAKEAYGSEQEWQRIFNLNPNYSSDATIPAGTRIRLTADARIGR